MMAITIAQTDPFEPYAERGKGKHKGHPVVPEPAMVGLLLIGFCVGLYAARRWWVGRGVRV